MLASVTLVAVTLFVGASMGLLLVWWGHPFIESFGLGQSLSGFWTVSVALAVVIVGAVAAYVPSRQIHHVDPASLLRQD